MSEKDKKKKVIDLRRFFQDEKETENIDYKSEVKNYFKNQSFNPNEPEDEDF